MTEQGLISHKIRLKKDLLANQKNDLSEIKQREQEVYSKITDGSTTEEIESVEKELVPIKEEGEAKETEVKKTEEDIAELERELIEVQKELAPPALEGGEGEQRNMDKELLLEQRDAVNAYIRKKEMRAVDGITSTDAALVIPEEVIYRTDDEVGEVPSLRHLVSVQPVKRASGKKPIRKHATNRLNSVAELEANPELAKPVFTEVDWSVETYRGAIPIAQEAIEDAEEDLTALVEKDAKEQKINTENYLITTALKSFTPLTIKSVDDLKDLLNVKIKRAYTKNLVITSSAFNILDKLKDKDGRYLLQPDVTGSTSGKLLGKTVEVIDDELFGSAGNATGFIGDTKRAALLSDRKQLEIKWVDHHIYGEYLRAGARMGVDVQDTNSGFFVTFDIKEETGEGA
ncbi:phage major capsid protein [Erysipelothrix anatis]|uniref:phage major capsid protein n=1 Tax=Erysipelothrix anatis TaxID=2683713 RepID=UPI0013582629|nr:phage major capsid protein [Erysipelothrix anatis]